jgi:hypothetical protein
MFFTGPLPPVFGLPDYAIPARGAGSSLSLMIRRMALSLLIEVRNIWEDRPSGI